MKRRVKLQPASTRPGIRASRPRPKSIRIAVAAWEPAELDATAVSSLTCSGGDFGFMVAREAVRPGA